MVGNQGCLRPGCLHPASGILAAAGERAGDAGEMNLRAIIVAIAKSLKQESQGRRSFVRATRSLADDDRSRE
jgi:hypothetical protein